ncbi:UNKNOWN [Stylonychia lemnae]|uniref:Uncharacterized protein n=1 Tax=Stylonychia lemnae TaxID=5949 RepID=A0A078AU97_STYLE|nr:UNKNOWN [Stylonychia lemnae]|eukprot:CDW85980.1 UNKNOWN [Stylonychia lemnae]
MSYGQYFCETGCEMYLSSTAVNIEDSNLLVCGIAGELNYHGVNDDGADDAFVMRLSETGWVEWYTQLSFQTGGTFISTTVALVLEKVYSYLTSNSNTSSSRSQSIVRLDYSDGKLNWAKKLKLINPINPLIPLVIERISDMMMNPWKNTQILFQCKFFYNTNYQSMGNLMINDDNSNLTTNFMTLVQSIATPTTSYFVPGQIVYDQDDNYYNMEQILQQWKKL